MKNIEELKNGYYKPTPSKWRKVGDMFQDVAILGGVIIASIAAPPAWLPVAIMVIGRIGKIITNFATE
jgi:hypothetical protein